MDFSVPYVQTTLMNDDIDIVFGKYSTPSHPYWSDCPVILSTDCERWFSNRFTIETCNFCKYHPVQGISPSVLMMMFPNGSIGFDNPFIFHMSHAKVPISTILGISIINWRNSRNQAPFSVAFSTAGAQNHGPEAGPFFGSAKALQFLDQTLQFGLPAIFASEESRVMILFVYIEQRKRYFYVHKLYKKNQWHIQIYIHYTYMYVYIYIYVCTHYKTISNIMIYII